MTEFSYLWTTSGTPSGDQVASYTQAHWAVIARILAACNGYQGVAPAYLNELEGTVAGANTVAINTGGAVVDGKPYQNGASVNVNIPSAVGGGNTRIDRIVLRVSWAGFTARITRIAGTDAASPTAPAITQTSGTTYDIPLYRALVNTSGTVTLTDERTWAGFQPDGSTIELDAGIIQVKDAGIVLAKLAADSVDDTKAGDRVPQFYRRQGGSATNWRTSGTTTYTPTAVRMQAGALNIASSATITFPTAFSNVPLFFPVTTGGYHVIITTVSATQAQLSVIDNSGTPATAAVYWLAIGPE